MVEAELEMLGQSHMGERPQVPSMSCLLPLQPIVKSIAGDVIDFPKPPKPVKVPPKEDHTSQVTVPLYLFNTVFGLLQTNGALDIDITPELVSMVPCPAVPWKY